ncbi:tRNA uridine-5-carboxymethylaminomethyl(34) synthesis GTPase MnmE [Paracholeplasma manati]|uniref:tRNA uridine-5-carboxymethylaminomethyl(34) synthesis GTPase MnmE n=1 Tax=Paracholeplasma manati TaxID=591373 RepID=UPI00240850D9|nr:tRNA uridine-5-carboxymethylaminomethyl(34) synthesis GTPase MnmE [Paracholeplasma manati]MDG0889422.1 tRNA uridine-5-carboxymethylaminomethyl(34) synthesis GTPase MnmE [Paracholeplasma manati]
MIYDTIAAIATPFGTAGIAIIRISGSESIRLANQVFKGRNLLKMKSHTVTYGHITDKLGNVIDEVMVTVMKAPKTFTAEDTVEISCHGGILVTQKVLERVLETGIKLAEPGEFSKRAYVNGRIDLTQAEAIMDLIHAKNENAMKLALSGLRGDIKKGIENIRGELLNIIAQIEVNIDYPEYDDATTMGNELIKPEVIEIRQKLIRLLDDSNKGKIMREGVKTAIVGKPNVGKSSLLNALLNEERAIVTDIEGTTRDTIEAYINIGNITLNLIDTAGIRETIDVVEKIGVDRSKKAIDEAELIILVLDQSRKISKEDIELLDATKDKKRIIVGNKNDLSKAIDLDIHMLSLSTLTKEGLMDLEKEIVKVLGMEDIQEKDFNVISNMRHIGKIKGTIQSLDDVLNAIMIDMPIDMTEIDLKKAWQTLGEITGDYHPEDLISELFSKFCLGK